ncbi:NADH dehydrogenase [ubiquinone] 1 beta subcomplex subunit 2, mitochondrial-like [Anastrepha ludens]|uniref:NADH dehydrogenase [ubiquinone] 1 beta subcomplex subunit 2, mitochondrial-like n=1 Tax=Anastrepha ludens TaxID=28586 RepID=UPI0023B12030|nr:NADH dehydrogenase [ubiquinone] 1 beta subcomplex subunit 2, mitochondrial-like [Anastrepha ludens]
MFRAILSVRNVILCSRKGPGVLKAINKQSIRNSHVVSYRTVPSSHSKITTVGAEIVGAAMWWWILWHLWHEYEHITGEFPYPSSSSWTNAELGIPPTKED